MISKFKWGKRNKRISIMANCHEVGCKALMIGGELVFMLNIVKKRYVIINYFFFR